MKTQAKDNHTPILTPPPPHKSMQSPASPFRVTLKTMIADANVQEVKVNTRISGLIKDVTDFLAENDRVRTKISEDRIALNNHTQ